MGNKYCYTKIIILGSGKLAYQCAVEGRSYMENVEVLEYKVTDSTVLQKMCQKDDIPYLCCEKHQLFQRLWEEKERTLVVSGGNTYLIPREIIEKDNLTIVNWHNALLPAHKGRNAEAWSIYAGEAVTGVTWHRIAEDVDAGDIIVQREIVIEPNTTALGLFKKQCELGATLFGEILEELLSDKSVFRQQEQIGEEQIHFSYEIPNGGYLSMDWPFEKMSCFLRAMDYGALQLLGEMHVEWNAKTYRFRKYKITDTPGMAGSIVLQDVNMTICKEGHTIILIGLEPYETVG